MTYSGFALAGFRSFGSQLQIIHPLRKVNFIVGRNDSGKSMSFGSYRLCYKRRRQHSVILIGIRVSEPIRCLAWQCHLT